MRRVGSRVDLRCLLQDAGGDEDAEHDAAFALKWAAHSCVCVCVCVCECVCMCVCVCVCCVLT